MKIDRRLAKDLALKIKETVGIDVQVTNLNGLIMYGKNRGEVSTKAIDAIRKKKIVFNSEKDRCWKNIEFEGKTIGAYTVQKEIISDEFLEALAGLAEVILYQNFLYRNLYSVTDMRAKFLKDILETETTKSVEEVLFEADVLKINLRDEQSAMIVRIEGLTQNYLKKITKLSESEKKVKLVEYYQEVEKTINHRFHDHDKNVVVYNCDDTFIVLKGMGTEDFSPKATDQYLRRKAEKLYLYLEEEFPNHKISIGVGQYYDSLSGLRKSYQEAQLALNMGQKIWENNKIFHIGDVGTYVVLSDDIDFKRKVEISEQALLRLLRDKDILKTVKVFLDEGMDLTKASKVLHLHRNTLIYRLKKVKDLIGLDPTNFNDALKIKLGLLVCKVD